MSRNNTNVSRRTHPSTTTVDTAVVIAVIVVIATKVEVEVEVVAAVDTAVATTIASSIILPLLALQARLLLLLPRALLPLPLPLTTVPSTPSTTALPIPMLLTVDTRTTSLTTSTISKWPPPSSRQMALLRPLLQPARPLLHLLARDPRRLHPLVQVAATARYVFPMSFMLVLITDRRIAGPPTPWPLSLNLFWWVNVVPSSV